MSIDSPRPRPLTTLVASAKRLTAKTISRTGSNAKAWQEDAWEMYDLVGEQRFLASTLANRLSQARFYVGEVNQSDSTEPPEPIEDLGINAVLDAFGSSASARAQLIQRLSVNLFVAGDGWLVGIPRTMMPISMQPTDWDFEDTPTIEVPDLFSPETAIEDLEWRMLSVSEVSTNSAGMVTLAFGTEPETKIQVSPSDIFLIRVWRPHPRRWWEADSPTRSSLPVLRELVGLTMHISAQVDSRLAGAGLLIVPQSAQRALNIAAGQEEFDDTDQFTEALMEAMITPISDRSSASAMVPLVVTVPDEVTDKFEFITFAKPLDAEARNLRDEAIRRLALGQDAPPELLLGTSGMNHWGAWLVREDVVTTHIEPPLALICDALTTQYLWPVLMSQGMSATEVQRYVIWYDVEHMIARPTRGQDATMLQERGVISDEALRDEMGFTEADAPAIDADPTDDLEPAIQMALAAATANPSLYEKPGLLDLVAQFRALLAGDIPDEIAEPEPVPPALQPDSTPVEGPPDTDGIAVVPPDSIAASAAANEHVLDILNDVIYQS